MRWFFVLEHLGGQGGVESVLTTVSTYLRDKGHEVVLLMPHPSDNPAWEVPLCTVYYAMSAPPPRSALDHVATRILGLCHTASLLPQPDVVVATHVPHTALYARMAFGHLRGVPVVSWLHARYNSSPSPIWSNTRIFTGVFRRGLRHLSRSSSVGRRMFTGLEIRCESTCQGFPRPRGSHAFSTWDDSKMVRSAWMCCSTA